MQALAYRVLKSGLALVLLFTLATGHLGCPLRKGRQQEKGAALLVRSRVGRRHLSNPS